MRERESDWNIPFLNYSVFYLMASVFLRAPTTKWTLVECSQMKLTETSSPTKKGVKNNTLFNLKKGVLCHACDGLFADEYLDHSSCPHAAPVAEGICDPVEADGGSSLSDGRRKNIIFEGKRWKKIRFFLNEHVTCWPDVSGEVFSVKCYEKKHFGAERIVDSQRAVCPFNVKCHSMTFLCPNTSVSSKSVFWKQ